MCWLRYAERMRRTRIRIALVCAALGATLVVSGGCKRKAPVNGIGAFEIGKTQLGQLNGRCIDASDPALMFCPGVAGVEIDKQHANIDLYFGGQAVDAKLVEILLAVNACQPEPLRSWLTDTLGEAAGQNGTRTFWSNEHVFISAGLPVEPGRCEINFVAAKDTARIERLKNDGV